MEFVTIKAKTRGKSTREVEYQGIGKFVGEGEDRHLVTSGVVTDIADLLSSAYKGNSQELIDDAVVGYNLRAYKEVSDQLAEFIDPNWSPEKIAIFRLAVNNLIKLGLAVENAVEMAKNTPALKAA